jgi:hypothetical protein
MRQEWIAALSKFKLSSCPPITGHSRDRSEHNMRELADTDKKLLGWLTINPFLVVSIAKFQLDFEL